MKNIKKVTVLAYLTLVGLIIALYINYNNKTQLGTYHLKQALGLHCTSIIFLFIPFFLIAGVGSDLLGVFSYLTTVILLVFVLGSISIYLLKLYLKAITNAKNGDMIPIPVYGLIYEKWFSFIK